MRKRALEREQLEHAPQVMADTWFRHATGRIDALKTRRGSDYRGSRAAVREQNWHRRAVCPSPRVLSMKRQRGAPVAMLVTDANPALNHFGLSGGVGLYTLDGSLPKPMRSIMDVIDAQSRRLNDVSLQLESARAPPWRSARPLNVPRDC
jgi:hypothetical protein